MNHEDLKSRREPRARKPRKPFNGVTVSRQQALAVIEALRSSLGEWAAGDRTLAQTVATMVIALDEAGVQPLQKCTGEAHSNAFIDNCMCCMPRWGWTGARVRIT